MQRIVLCIATLFLFSSFAAGQDDSAGRMEDLVRRCQGNASVRTDATEKLIENTMERGFCFGFFSGILSANAIATGVLGSPLFCTPRDGISLDQAIKVYLKYAQDHPEQLHESARSTVVVAFRLAFPCNQ